MKKYYLFLLFVSLLFISNYASSQSYTTHSKSCGSCEKPVSNDSKIGMRCPHCGVRWGYENEKRSTSYNLDSYSSYDNSNSYDGINGLRITNTKVNLRSKPTTKSAVLTVIPQYGSVSIISRTGDWYFVEYTYLAGANFRKIRGYVYKTLI